MLSFAQLRCTVRSDTLRETAISTNGNPQKNFRSITSARPGASLPSSSKASLICLRFCWSMALFAASVSHAVISKLTSTLLGVAFPCMVDDQTTHHADCVSHEPSSAGKRSSLATLTYPDRLRGARSLG